MEHSVFSLDPKHSCSWKSQTATKSEKIVKPSHKIMDINSSYDHSIEEKQNPENESNTNVVFQSFIGLSIIIFLPILLLGVKQWKKFRVKKVSYKDLLLKNIGKEQEIKTFEEKNIFQKQNHHSVSRSRDDLVAVQI